METQLLIGLGAVLAFGSFALFSWWNSEAERTKRALRRVAIRPIQSLREGECCGAREVALPGHGSARSPSASDAARL